MRCALVLALASCGRIGFGLSGGDGDGGVSSGADTVRVVVAADFNTPGAAPGTPIESATVLVDRGAGTLERLLTDAEGSVTLDTEGVVAYHVVYGSDDAWRVYTVATGAAETVSLGGLEVGAGGTVTIVLPSGPGNSYSAHLPEHCQSIYEPFGSPSVSILYSGFCDGQLVRVIGFVSSSTSNVRYVDAGLVRLAPGAQTVVSGSYAPLPTHTIELTSVPAEAERISGEILARNQVDLTPVESSSSPTSVLVTGPTMTLTTTAGAGGDTLRVVADVGRAGRAFRSTSEQIVPVSFSAAPFTASFDASTLLPAFTSFDFDTELNVSWVGGGAAGTMIVMRLSADSFDWDAYLPPGATGIAFPAIPADIGFPRQPTVGSVQLMRIAVPGATAVGLTPTIDRTSRRWPHNDVVFPASGNRMALAFYLGGFLTDPTRPRPPGSW